MQKEVPNKKPNSKKLTKFGFIKLGKEYVYNTNILNGDFQLTITINSDNINTKLVEVETGDLYTLHLTNTEGTFVGKVREEYDSILYKIFTECFDANIFKTDYANKIINYVREKYGDEFEYLWEKTPDNAIARRKDNSKWYILILTVLKDRFGFDSEEKVEVINIRAKAEDVPELVKKNNIYPAYHMNKKYWISIILNEAISIEEIYEKIDESYVLAGKKK